MKMKKLVANREVPVSVNFLYVQLGCATFGQGATLQEAIEDAKEGLDNPETGYQGVSYDEAERLLVPSYDRAVHGDMVILEKGVDEAFEHYLD